MDKTSELITVQYGTTKFLIFPPTVAKLRINLVYTNFSELLYSTYISRMLL